MKQHVQDADNEKGDSNNNGKDVETFLNAAAGAVHAAISSECKSGISAACLQKNRSTEQNRENNEENIENHITDKDSRIRAVRKEKEGILGESWRNSMSLTTNYSHKLQSK